MNFIKRLSLVFLIAILGVCEIVAANSPYSLGLVDAARQSFKRPLATRAAPGADSPFAPHSPSISPVASSVSGEGGEGVVPQFVPLKRARGERARGGGGSTDGSTVTTASKEVVLPRTAGGSPTLSVLVKVAAVVALKPKATLYRSRLSPQQQAKIKARRAQFSAAAYVPVPAPIPVVDAPLGDARPRIAVAQAYAPLGFQKAREVVEPIAPLAVYNLTGNWRLDKNLNYQISEVGCTVTDLGKEKIATVFYNGVYGAYLSPDFIAEREDLLRKRVRIIGAGNLAEDVTSDISVVISTWDKIALFKRFSSFEEGKAWVEQAIAQLGISFEKMRT